MVHESHCYFLPNHSTGNDKGKNETEMYTV